MKGEIAVRYTIRHFDLPLLTFEANMDSADTDLHIIKVYEENRSFLPLNLTVSEDGVERWLRHRTIPKNRAYVDALLSKVGLSLNRPLGIIAANKGLSLNDCFWVDAEGSGDTFEKVNLYDNRFSQVLAAIAFTGYGSSIRTSLASCPEFSTNGMLPKCWRRQNGKIYLYKGGTSGFSNFGFEPYSELYAYQVAQVIGVNAIRYTLTKDLKKTLCSKCELFTSKEYSYIPIGQLVSKGGIEHHRIPCFQNPVELQPFRAKDGCAGVGFLHDMGSRVLGLDVADLTVNALLCRRDAAIAIDVHASPFWLKDNERHF